MESGMIRGQNRPATNHEPRRPAGGRPFVNPSIRVLLQWRKTARIIDDHRHPGGVP
jgi:hypothetical protein